MRQILQSCGIGDVTTGRQKGQGQAVGARTLEVRAVGTRDVTALAADELSDYVPHHRPKVVVQNTVWTAGYFTHRYHTLPALTLGGGPNKRGYWMGLYCAVTRIIPRCDGDHPTMTENSRRALI